MLNQLNQKIFVANSCWIGIYTLAPEMLKIVSIDLGAISPTAPIGEYQTNWARRLLIAGTKLIREGEKDYKLRKYIEASPISLLRESVDIVRNYRVTLGK